MTGSSIERQEPIAIVRPEAEAYSVAVGGSPVNKDTVTRKDWDAVSAPAGQYVEACHGAD